MRLATTDALRTSPAYSPHKSNVSTCTLKSTMSSSFPSPPESLNDFVDEKENNVLVSMSTTFYPREDSPSDLIIVTEDSVFFSVHKHILLSKSQNLFGRLLELEETQCLTVPESSEIMNLVLHAFYDFDPTLYRPTLDDLAAMLLALPKYGLPVSVPVAYGTPIHNLMLSAALKSPLEVYSLAAQHHLEQLAVGVSHHLLDTPLHNVTDAHSLSMGPIYLRRLMFLHLGRTERLKTLLRDPPTSHIPTMQCDGIDQKRKLGAVWQVAVNSLCWDANASTPISLFHAVLSPLVNELTCEECKTAMRERIRKLIVDWTLVKTTI